MIAIIASIAIAAQFLHEADSARADLTAAKDKITLVPAMVRKNDAAGLNRTAGEIKTLTASALKTTSGGLWDFATRIPWIGANISAVQKTTQAADILVDGALPPAMQLMATLQPAKLKLKGGGIDLRPFVEAQRSLPGVIDAFASAHAMVSTIDRSKLLPYVNDSIGGLLDIIDQATPALKTVQRVLPTLLPMAGSEGPRNYLLIFQNLAEIRATGGNAAATAQIRVDKGHITLVDQANSLTFYAAGTVRHQYVKLPGSMLKIYPSDTTLYSQNYTRTPNFPIAAKLFSGLWKATSAQKLDGVISLDPVVLSEMLKVTGPVKVAGDTLTSKNVVKTVLSDAYERFPRGTQSDAYFAAVASAVFEKVTAGNWDPVQMFDQLAKAADQQRLYAWFAHKDEQALAVEAGIDGEMLSSNTKNTEVGVFLNDYTIGKLQYWLTSSVKVTCDAAARTVTTSIAITNTIPNGNFSSYTLGWRDRLYGQPRTSMLMDVLYFSPPDAPISATRTGGDIASLARSGTEQGRSVQSVTVIVPMGKTHTVSFTSTLPKGALGPISVRHTPTVTDTPVTIADSCRALTAEG
ncbi:DUF4012 domain-containing protein [Microbacterium kribbense]|uniref:DUF4012 domain-containing protein n=1 Tax=Microbacterium kribbense TaxID=433645 RepID=A0ABP7GIK7_9MICO